ncbi:alpha/beta hydrolase family esterase [Spirochaetota bacterium]
MKKVLLTCLFVISGLVFMSCGNQADLIGNRNQVDSVSKSISDGAHTVDGNLGNQHFFFLAPLVPMPETSGVFDGAVSPEVEICQLEGSACTTAIASFTMATGPGSETVRVVPEDEHYIVNWHTDEFNLDITKQYRIRIIAFGVELGFADVSVGATGKDLKNINTDEYIALKDGRTLPIKFRIEVGADPCLEMICNTPPESYCSDNDILVNYSENGICSSGSCTYDSNETACDNGCSSGTCIDPQPSLTGMQTIISNGVERTYFLQMPGDYNPSMADKPLVMAFHGTGGYWWDFFLENIGDDAIMVYPYSITYRWNYDDDFQYFEDILADLDEKIVYNKNKLFLTGYSSGAGIAHELGCRYGDIVRAIAPVAGSLLSNECVGSVGVMQIQGTYDTSVPLSIAENAHNYWVLYNGFDIEISSPWSIGPCVDHSMGASDYPMIWCQHDGGHGWPNYWEPGPVTDTNFANEAIWSFFSGLPEVSPSTDEPLGGGNDRANAAFDTTISFTLRYPETVGEVFAFAITLYPAGTQKPIMTAPSYFLNYRYDVSGVIPGDEISYQVPIKLGTFKDVLINDGATEMAINIMVYVVGGGYPQPSGLDYIILKDYLFTGPSDPVIIEEPIDVQ